MQRHNYSHLTEVIRDIRPIVTFFGRQLDRCLRLNLSWQDLVGTSAIAIRADKAADGPALARTGLGRQEEQWQR
jgi:hypothetical protein